MKVFGIIAEYNPFHNGHLYQIKKVKEAGASHIVAVMSGNFVQRGEPAFMDKFIRANLAVKCGIDLIIELPVGYAVSTAETFATGAVSILNSLGFIDILSFGSECGDINMLNRVADTVDIFSNSVELRQQLKKGTSFPSAMQNLVENNLPKDFSGILSSPNNLLGLEYIRAIRKFNAKFGVFPIERKYTGHDSMVTTSNFASASYIRQGVSNGINICNFVPHIVNDAILEYFLQQKNINPKFLEKLILYKLHEMDEKSFETLPEISQGLDNRIFSMVKNCLSVENLLSNVKTKRFTMAKIRRVILSAVLGLTKTTTSKMPPYGRILALNNKGCELLRQSNPKFPLNTSLKKLSLTDSLSKEFAEIEAFSTDVYTVCQTGNFQTGSDYTTKIQKQ